MIGPVDITDWWTSTDVAAYLGISIKTVSSYRHKGFMPAPDLTIGRTHMWKPERIKTWHAARPRPDIGERMRKRKP